MNASAAVLRALAAAVALGAVNAARGQGGPDYERPPIAYSAATPADAVAALQQRIAGGDFAWPGGERALLAAVLRELQVPVASQVAVFSRTSLQRGRIRPARPRVIYFSDTVYVGWVPGGLIELTAVDPRLGPVFYTLEAPIREGAPVKLARDAECLSCHGGTFVRDVPGVFVRSVFPDASGEPLLRFGTLVVDDQTPFSERWGGWYVTGYHGETPHRGNAFAADVGGELAFTPAFARPDDLSGLIDAGPYLAPTSDVVALLVLEHQTALQNVLTRAAFATRRMIAYQRSLQRQFREPETDEPAFDSVRSVFRGSAQEIVDRLLCRGEAPLPVGIIGAPAFRAAWAEGAPRDAAGRSLRDLHLEGRLLRHRCSPLIYSEMFAALPEPLRELVFAQLAAALADGEIGGRYAHLLAEERRAIWEILRATHPEAQRRWTAAGGS
jgi:hypothetical protein